MLAGVSAVGDTEAEVKVEALQQVIAEVVSLDHAEVVEGPVSDGEFHPGWIKTARRETDSRVIMLLCCAGFRFSVSGRRKQCRNSFVCQCTGQVSVFVSDV